MTSIMDLLAKADEIINAKPDPDMIAKDKLLEEYKRKVRALNEEINIKKTIESRLQFVNCLTQPNMLNIVGIQWLLTWSASLRWSMMNLGDEIKCLYEKYYDILQEYIIKKTIQKETIVSQIKLFEEFIEKNKKFADYYHYEFIRYLSVNMTNDIWTSLSETDRKYIIEFIEKMDGSIFTIQNITDFLEHYK